MKQQNLWRKGLSLALALVMVLALGACSGGKDTPAPAPGPGESPAASPSSDTAPAAPDYPATPTEPVTIQYWHGNSGVNEEHILSVVKEFNETNQYGITVEATYAGKYPEILSKTSTAIASGDAPHIIMMSSTEIPVLAEAGSLADLSGFIARDGIDMENFVGSMMSFCKYNGQILTLPYQRSVPILYYNKTMFDEMDLHEPTSFEDLTEMSKTIYQKSGGKTAGAGFLIDNFFYQEALVRSLGADGILKKDGSGPACLGVEHRGFHLQKGFAIQILPHSAYNFRALGKYIPHLRVHNEIQIPLAVSGVCIPQAMILLRQRQQRLGKDGNAVRLHRNLPALGAESLSLHAYNVSDIQGGHKGFVRLLPHHVNFRVNLHLPGHVPQVHKGGLAHAPAAHNPPGHRHLFPFQLLKVLHNLPGLLPRVKGDVLIRIPALLLHGKKLVPADLQNFL